MSQPAYDYYSYDTAVRRRAQHPRQNTVPLRVENGGKRRLNPMRAAMRHAVQLVAVALLAALAASLLWSESQLVELNDQIQETRAELTSEQSQYTYYTSTLNSMTSIGSIEETAGRLGLMKADSSQITYVRLNEAGVLVRRESAVRKWTDLFHDGALMFVNAIRPAT